MNALDQLITWCDKLHACTSLVETGGLLCRGLADMTGADSVSMFIFDYTGQELHCKAHSSAGQTYTITETIQYEKFPEDPVCFAIRTGNICSVAFSTATNMPSLQIAAQTKASAPKHFVAVPFGLPRQASMGAILFGGAASTVPDAAMLFLKHTATFFSLLAAKEQSSALTHTLRHDIERLEKRLAPEEDRIAREIIGNSLSIQNIRRLASKASTNAATVLVTGETGTGKELVSSVIHRLSERRDKPFMTINCAALPEALLESELFGHEKGAFSGATSAFPGLFRSAAGGTVLLDEIGDMPLNLQTKLLRFLQEKTVRPVGSAKDQPVDVRIIAATNSDLHTAVDAGTFRRDLFHRLAVFPVELPPLRERKEDIVLLAEHFIRHLAAKYQRPTPKLLPDDVAVMLTMPFPGNVRELAALLERSLILWVRTQPFRLESLHATELAPTSLADAVQNYEKELICSVFAQCQSNTKAAAEILGLPRRTLAHKLQRYGISLAAH